MYKRQTPPLTHLEPPPPPAPPPRPLSLSLSQNKPQGGRDVMEKERSAEEREELRGAPSFLGVRASPPAPRPPPPRPTHTLTHLEPLLSAAPPPALSLSLPPFSNGSHEEGPSGRLGQAAAFEFRGARGGGGAAPVGDFPRAEVGGEGGGEGGREAGARAWRGRDRRMWQSSTWRDGSFSRFAAPAGQMRISIPQLFGKPDELEGLGSSHRSLSFSKPLSARQRRGTRRRSSNGAAWSGSPSSRRSRPSAFPPA